jgi:peroxin-6
VDYTWNIQADGDWLACSPLLAFNLSIQHGDTATVYKSNQAFTAEPPVASSITLARIASPASQSTVLHTACLDALTKWFQSSNRIVRMEDVVRIRIDSAATTVASRVVSVLDKSVNEEADAKKNVQALRSATGDYVKRMKQRHGLTECTDVYFSVTQVVPSATTDWGGVHRVDPEHTRVIQMGMVQSRLPPTTTPHAVSLETEGCFDVFHQLKHLLQASLTPLPPPFDASMGCSVLLYGARGTGKTTGIEWAASALGIHLHHVNIYALVNEVEAKTETALKATFDKASEYSPCVLYLQHAHALAKKSAQMETGIESKLVKTLQQCITRSISSNQAIMVVATTTDKDAISPAMAGCFQHTYTVQAPDEHERLAILQSLVREIKVARDVSLKSVAMQTAAFLPNDLYILVEKAERCARERAYAARTSTNQPPTPQLVQRAGVVVRGSDFSQCLGEMRSTFSDNIGAPKIPNVQWADIGGLAAAKQDILDTVQLPLEHPELFADGVKKRSGVLLYGPPGSGKTLLAKAVATSCSLNFFSVKGPELLNMYIGESEANVRRVFQRARDARPCVIFFDELDSIAPKRGEKGDSGGVMDRIVSQLLAELDGVSGNGTDNVFVMAATNRPDLLDAALLRPGRFDKLIYLGVSNDRPSQMHILKALTRKFRLDPSLDLNQVAEACPLNYTGADFYALCSDAMLLAMIRTAEQAEARLVEINKVRVEEEVPWTIQHYLDNIATDDQVATILHLQDFQQALSNVVPSVSIQELAYYDRLRLNFQQ